MSADLAAVATRAQRLGRTLDRSLADGTVIIVNDPVGDLLVDGEAIRDLSRVFAARAAERGMATLRYTLAGGVETVAVPNGPLAQPPSGIGEHTPPTVALDMLRDACLRASVPHLIVVEFAEHLLPEEEMQSASGDTARIVEQLAVLATDPTWANAGHRVVLVGRTSSVDRRVAALPGMTVIDQGLPEVNEREAALRRMVESPRHQLVLAPGLDLARTARLAGGMSIHALSAMRMHSSAASPLTIDQIIAYKRGALRQAAGDTLIVHDELLSLEHDVAGLPQVRWTVDDVRLCGGDRVLLILVGPPGNGKTRVATAVAAELGVPAIELGTILNRYVGDSEANLRRALDAISANAPCLVILDEVDETFLGRRGDSVGGEGGQVTSNLRAALFSWLGDVGAQNGISVIGMTNRPDRLDEAALDRFTIVPVLHPSPLEAAAIMSIQARREGVDLDGEGAARALARARVTFSGRQAVRLLGRSHLVALRAGRTRVEEGDVAAAIGEALHGIGPEEELQALLAVAATSWKSHLPWIAARHYGDEAAVPPPYMAGLVTPDGSVAMDKLSARIDELRARRGL